MENKINGIPGKAGVLVKLEVKKKTAAGVYLPESAWTKEGIVEVLAIGEFCKQAKVGQWIMIGAESRPKTICIEGVIYGVLQEYEIDWFFETKPENISHPELEVAKESKILVENSIKIVK